MCVCVCVYTHTSCMLWLFLASFVVAVLPAGSQFRQHVSSSVRPSQSLSNPSPGTLVETSHGYNREHARLERPLTDVLLKRSKQGVYCNINRVPNTCANNVGQTTTLFCVAHQATVLYMLLCIILLSNSSQHNVWVWG